MTDANPETQMDPTREPGARQPLFLPSSRLTCGTYERSLVNSADRGQRSKS